MKKCILILLLIPFIAQAQLDSDQVITVYTSNPKFSIQVKKKPQPGFSWSIKEMDNELFNKVDKIVRSPRSKLLGTPSEKTFNFELKPRNQYPAQSEITLFYAQDKKAQKGIIKRYTIKIIDDTN